jgi:hypothetical protein
MINFAKVMNGYVHAGDKIAYPGRWASSLWTNMADVLEVVEIPVSPWNKSLGTQTALKVEVYSTSGYADVPYRTMIQVLDRVVKL